MTDDDQKLADTVLDALRDCIELFRNFQPADRVAEARQTLTKAATAYAQATTEWRRSRS